MTGGRTAYRRLGPFVAVLAAVALVAAVLAAAPRVDPDRALAVDSLRTLPTRERFYFVLPDRFANGDPTNDTGGYAGDRLGTGFDPTDKAFYHGGDLAGLTAHLDYVAGLGATAIWITPPFVNAPVQGPSGSPSAGYHGYWITDFTRVDPHLGTDEDLATLVREAHARGLKVVLDIITNHTADGIASADGDQSYVDKASVPYRDAAGTAFDDQTYAGGSTFPAMTPQGFPRIPVVRPGFHKTPAWLDDVTMYHNRGDSTFEGESSLYGDFAGLDDLFTERPEVVDGMIDIYRRWVDAGVDGFRVDTVKHVNTAFWQRFVPAIQAEARRVGTKDFLLFGEVYAADSGFESTFTTTGRFPAVLDFGLQQAGTAWLKGQPGTALADFFAADDWFTDADSNVYVLPTFLGNHDMGRAAMFAQTASFDDETLRKRTELGQALLYLVRGQPVTYYGDEQGFIGDGGDQLARQDMFATRVPEYLAETPVAGTAGARDRYDTEHPLYRQLAGLAALRTAHPALADGAQIPRFAADGEGIFAVSRYDRVTGHEYVVALNNSTAAASATFPTYAARAGFSSLLPGQGPLTSGADGQVNVRLAPLSYAVWRADAPVPVPASAPVVHVPGPPSGVVAGRTEIAALVDAPGPVQVTFAVRPVGREPWTTIGTDDTPPYRVFHDPSAFAPGTAVEYRVVAKDTAGHVGGASAAATVMAAAG